MRQEEERCAFDDLAAQLQALAAEHSSLQAEHAALREAEQAARAQLELRDSLVRVLGEEARQQAGVGGVYKPLNTLGL